MQKKLIALAIAAAFSAPAFADVTVYGIVDAAIAHASGDGQKSDTIVVSGGLSASRLGVKTVEDLNNGMKAVVVVEYGLDGQNGTALGAARQTMLAVAGDFGTVATGYLQTTGYDFAVKFDPTAGSAVSPLQTVTKGGVFLIGSSTIASRAPRALAYISPNMGGVTVAVNYSTDTNLDATVNTIAAGTYPAGSITGLGNVAQPTAGTDMKIPAYLMSVSYDQGPLAIGAVYANANVAALSGNIKDMAVGASYDLGVAKLFGTYQNTKFLTSPASKAMSLSVVAPVGPGAVAFTYAKNSMTTANTNGKGMTLAWLQGLSKTSTMYVAVEKVSQDTGTNAYSVYNNALGGGLTAQGAAVAGNTALTAGGSSTLLAVGLKKTF